MSKIISISDVPNLTTAQMVEVDRTMMEDYRIELMAWHRCHLAWILTKHHCNVRAPIRQPPNSDQRSAAISATTGQGDDRAATRITIEKPNSGQMREVAPRIFHHLDQLDPIVLDHPAVDLDHLIGSQIGYVGDAQNFQHRTSMTK